jgi:sulfatase modifying factor 1
MKINRLILTGLIVLLTSVPVSAATVNWNISGSGLWSESTYWSSGTVPDSEDDVFINNSGPGTITVGADAAAKTLTVGGEKKITLSTGGKLTISAGAPCDTTPDAFTLTDQTGVALSQPITSTSITVSGITCASPISITGGTYSINGAIYTSASGTVSLGNTVTVKLTSSGSYTTSTNAILTIGGVSDTFSVTTLYGTGDGQIVTTFSDYANMSWGLGFDSAGILYATDWGTASVWKINAGVTETPAWVTSTTPLPLNLPVGIAFDGFDNAYIGNRLNHNVLMCDKAVPPGCSVFAGDTANTAGDVPAGAETVTTLNARFNNPYGVAHYDSFLYVADANNHKIRKIDLKGNNVTTFAVMADYPQGVAVDTAKNVYVCTASNAIYRYTSDGTLDTTYTLPDTPNTPYIYGVAVNSAGYIYAVDYANHIIWQITPTGIATVYAGTPGVSGLTDGTFDVAKFNYPRAIAIDAAGDIYVADADNNKIRKISNDYTSVNIGTLKYVPAGTFQRDTDATHTSSVTTAFRMSQYEITQAQYVAVTGSNPSHFTLANSHTDDTSRPVENLTWYDAVEFCNDLSTSEGLTPVYTITRIDPVGTGHPILNATVAATWTNTGYRLPTEMEWEWAAMGATSGSGWSSPTYLTGYGKLFAGSNATNAAGDNGTNAIGDYAWYSIAGDGTGENSYGTTHPVGTTGGTTDHANELGLYDMSGNVWELVWDWYVAAYPDGALASNTDAGRGATSGTSRVIRGGSWYNSAPYATVAYRGDSIPEGRNSRLGFRVVRP